MFSDHPVGIMLSNSAIGTENLTFPYACKGLGAEANLQNNSLKVSPSMGMLTDVRLTILLLGTVFTFSFWAINTAKVCRSTRRAVMAQPVGPLQMFVGVRFIHPAIVLLCVSTPANKKLDAATGVGSFV